MKSRRVIGKFWENIDMPNRNLEFELFKKCVNIQAGLDLEAWDVMLFQPLKSLAAWWSRQSDATKLYTGFLGGVGGTAFTRWIARVAEIASAEAAGLFAEALSAVLVGVSLGTFLDVVGRCCLV
jgi:hypothetical protein